MLIKSEKEQKYIKKMIEVERIKQKRSGIRRKEENARRMAKNNTVAA